MNRAARALIGYLSREAAAAVLNGGAQPSAAQLDGFTESWRIQKRRVDERPMFVDKSPIVRQPPLAAKRLIAAITERPEVQSTFAPHKWEIGIVDLNVPIATFQSIVNTEDALDRVAGAGDDW